MPEYIVKNSAVLHNGKRYEEGSSITLKSEEAEPLREKGFLEEKPVREKKDGKKEDGK